MTTLKAYTDLEQSEKLAEILPLESADMHYIIMGDDEYPQSMVGLGEYIGVLPTIPCWSLAALLESIPQEIFDGEYIIKYTINIREGSNNRWVLTYDHYENENHPYYGLSSDADNLVDACYEMILKLHEQNLL